MKTGLDVSRIKGIRMSCRKCGSEWMIPLAALQIPRNCFNCSATVPNDPIQDALRGIAHLKAAATSDGHGFQFNAVIEKEAK